MPLYDFECEPCAYYAEIKQGPNDPSIIECPLCGEKNLKKVYINSPAFFVRGEPSTIGQVMDRNTEKMGKYEIQKKNKDNNINQDKEAIEVKATRRKINSMTPEQKVKWIKEGD